MPTPAILCPAEALRFRLVRPFVRACVAGEGIFGLSSISLNALLYKKISTNVSQSILHRFLYSF